MPVLYHPICWELLCLVPHMASSDTAWLQHIGCLGFPWIYKVTWPIFLSHFTIESQRQKDLKEIKFKLKSDCCRTEFPPPCLGGIYFQRKVSRSQRKMMRRLLVYWHCPRHVMCRGLLVVILKRFYPGWLRFHCPAVCNLFFTIVCAWGYVLRCTSWRGPDTLLPTPLVCQLRSSCTLPWHLWQMGTCTGKGKAE